MSLQEYGQKRDFEMTAEPSGQEKSSDLGNRYLIQKHAASHLHYDLRLELDGVLKSWAVPKGPSYDPKERRLAMHVEDHPLDYGGFEGIIPKGQYGGGTVMLWDEGTWEPLEDPHKGYHAGKLKFRLHGKKLQGIWALVQMHGERSDNGRAWLWIKDRDDRARPHCEFDILTEDRSVVSGRSMEAIANAADEVWQSNADAPDEKADFELIAREISAARKSALPEKLEPQLASLVAVIPQDDEWAHEIKYDGYRILARLENGQVKLLSRRTQNWTATFPTIATALSRLPLTSAFLDGELVVLKPDGKTDFQSLQNTLHGQGHGTLVYYAFDLPYCQGFDLRQLTLLERKEALHRLLPESAQGCLRYSDHIVGNGPAVLEHSRQLGLEGVISKRVGSHYEGKRSGAWLKSKCLYNQEFVIGAYTEPGGGRSHFGALLLGTYQGSSLVFCGKVGTGFNERSLEGLHAKLKPLETKDAPFSNPPKGAAARGVHWVKPELVAQVEFMQWTEEGILRHPSFKGLREDKLASQVRMEKPVAAPRRSSEPTVEGLKISNPGRVIDPDSGLTKLQLVEYYQQIAPRILEHIADRPLTLVRCPEGVGGQSFFQKHLKEGFPKSVRSVPIQSEDSAAVEDYLVIDSAAGLVACIQMGAIDLHPWGSKEDDLERPDRLIFDLDPDPAVPWSEVTEAALEVRGFLEMLGLESFCKTTGGKGLHVVVPLLRRVEWPQAKEFCRAVAERMAEVAPRRYLANMSKAKRKGRIFLDYLRNGRGATSVAAYSARSRPHCPISTPVDWGEVNAALDPLAFTPLRWKEREKRDREVWAGFGKTRQSITKAILATLGLES